MSGQVEGFRTTDGTTLEEVLIKAAMLVQSPDGGENRIRLALDELRWALSAADDANGNVSDPVWFDRFYDGWMYFRDLELVVRKTLIELGGPYLEGIPVFLRELDERDIARLQWLGDEPEKVERI